jgi:hypothetical protein
MAKAYQTKVPKGAVGKGLIDMMAIFLAGANPGYLG